MANVRADAHSWSFALINGWNLAFVGYGLVAVGLLLDLPTIGASGTSAAISIAIAAMIGIGILVAAAGMMQLRRRVDRDQIGVRRGLGMQGLGLIILLAGVLALQVSSSLPVLLVSAVIVVTAAGLAIVGAFLLRKHYSEMGAQSTTALTYLIVGTAMIFVGVGVIVVSEIGYFFVLSDLASTVVNDVGVAVCGSGCVVGTYSAFVMRSSARRNVRGVQEGSSKATRGQASVSRVTPS